MKVQALLNAEIPPSSTSPSSAIAVSSQQLPQLPTRRPSVSSHGSSPSRSPTTSSIPPLERSDSSDSAGGTSPSPLTPNATALDSYQRIHNAKQSVQQPYLYQRPQITHLRSYHNTYPSMDTPSDSFPPTPQSASGDFNFPQMSTHAQSNPYFRPSLHHSNSSFSLSQPTQAQQVLPQSQLPQPQIPGNTALHSVGQQSLMYPDNSLTASKSTKKNSYPCPVSKQYNCHEFFTTSGHAARHAKKHTGKKDAICPECGKAFTRKDNMEQHRRTHSGTRASLSSATAKPNSKTETPEESRARRMRQQQRKARPSSISAASTAGPDLAMLDPALRGSPTGGIFPLLENASSPYIFPQAPLAPTAVMQQQAHSQNLDLRLVAAPVSASGPRYPSPPDASTSPSLAPALDALALAASRQEAPDN